MARSKRDIREEEIEAAAYRLLEERGFAGTGMQAIAQAAHASNETLYRWYGDKTGLYRALIARNAALVVQQIEASRALGYRGLAGLEQVGSVLLAMLLGDRAMALNRAAAADHTGLLGRVLAEAGRETVAPLLVEIIAEALAERQLGHRAAPRIQDRLPGDGAPPAETPEAGALATDLTELWLTLLTGDLQVRRMTGAISPLSETQIAARSAQAVDRLLRLYPPLD